MYKHKYLKYKNKYLQLKSKLYGGSNIVDKLYIINGPTKIYYYKNISSKNKNILLIGENHNIEEISNRFSNEQIDEFKKNQNFYFFNLIDILKKILQDKSKCIDIFLESNYIPRNILSGGGEFLGLFDRDEDVIDNTKKFKYEKNKLSRFILNSELGILPIIKKVYGYGHKNRAEINYNNIRFHNIDVNQLEFNTPKYTSRYLDNFYRDLRIGDYFNNLFRLFEFRFSLIKNIITLYKFKRSLEDFNLVILDLFLYLIGRKNKIGREIWKFTMIEFRRNIKPKLNGEEGNKYKKYLIYNINTFDFLGEKINKQSINLDDSIKNLDRQKILKFFIDDINKSCELINIGFNEFGFPLKNLEDENYYFLKQLVNYDNLYGDLFNAYNKIESNIISIIRRVIDYYTINRMFRKFDLTGIKGKRNHPICNLNHAENIIVYAGINHIEFINKILQDILFKLHKIILNQRDHNTITTPFEPFGINFEDKAIVFE